MANKKISIVTAICVLLTASVFSMQVSNDTEAASYLTTSVKANPHMYITKKYNGYDTQFIRVDNSPESEYKVIVAPGKDNWQFLWDIMNDYQAVDWMNGAYFSPKAYWNLKNETHSDRIHEGVQYSKWPTDTGDRVIMWFDKAGSTIMHQTDKLNVSSKKDIVEGIGNFPALLINWKDVVNDRAKLIDAKMKAKANKTFLCSDDNKGVYFGIIKNISITEMPKVLKSIGCTNALNMDAGASTSLVYNLNTKVKSWSPVMDWILVVKKKWLTKTEQKKLSNLKSGTSDTTKYDVYSGYQKVKNFFK